MVSLDDWIPNFDLFVMQLLPALILVTFLIILVEYWSKKKKKQKKPMDWMDIMLWLSAIYFIIPLYRIVLFLTGDKSFTVLLNELFVDDFYNYMALMLIVGMGGTAYIFMQKWKEGVGN